MQKLRKNSWPLIVLLALSGPVAHGKAKELVTDDAINAQKEMTHHFSLSNDIRVVYREVPGSEIVNLVVNFDFGLRDLPHGKKSQSNHLFSTMAMAARGFSKTRVFRLTEQYALQLGCSDGLEVSSCSLGTVNEYWQNALPLFAAIVKEPTLSEADLKLTAERLQARARQGSQDPSSYVNDVANRVFYEANHPFYVTDEQVISELGNFKRSELVPLHKQILNAKRMVITVVGSKDLKSLKADLERHFGKIKGQDSERPPVPRPRFDPAKNFEFEHRDIPTAYLLLKFNGVDLGAEDELAVSIMIDILSDLLSEEIRTRRSLTYAVYAQTLQHSIGIGAIQASTSKPKETLEAIRLVIDRLKKKPLSEEDLAERKTVYATGYFLRQETHGSLASSLSSHYLRRGSLDYFYYLPKKLASLTPKDIQQAAQNVLINFRVGVIYERKQFEDAWVQQLVREFSRGPTPAESSKGTP